MEARRGGEAPARGRGDGAPASEVRRDGETSRGDGTATSKVRRGGETFRGDRTATSELRREGEACRGDGAGEDRLVGGTCADGAERVDEMAAAMSAPRAMLFLRERGHSCLSVRCAAVLGPSLMEKICVHAKSG